MVWLHSLSDTMLCRLLRTVSDVESRDGNTKDMLLVLREFNITHPQALQVLSWALNSTDTNAQQFGGELICTLGHLVEDPLHDEQSRKIWQDCGICQHCQDETMNISSTNQAAVTPVQQPEPIVISSAESNASHVDQTEDKQVRFGIEPSPPTARPAPPTPGVSTLVLCPAPSQPSPPWTEANSTPRSGSPARSRTPTPARAAAGGGGPPPDNSDSSDGDDDKPRRTPHSPDHKRPRSSERQNGTATPCLRTDGQDPDLTEAGFYALAGNHEEGRKLWRATYAPTDINKLKAAILCNKGKKPPLSGVEYQADGSGLGGNYAAGPDLWSTGAFALQICDDEDLPVPDHSRLWIELFLLKGSPAERHFTHATRNFLKMCINEIIYVTFLHFSDTHACLIMYERKKELLLTTQSFADLIWKSAESTASEMTLSAMFDEIWLILSKNHNEDNVNTSEAIQIFCRVLPETLKEQMKAQLNPSEHANIFKLSLDRFRQAIRQVNPVTQVDMRRMIGTPNASRRTHVASAPAEAAYPHAYTAPPTVLQLHTPGETIALAPAETAGVTRPMQVAAFDTTRSPPAKADEEQPRPLPDWIQRELDHPKKCLPCIKLGVVQMRVNRAGKCPFDAADPDNPKYAHWRAWLGKFISGVEIPGWTEEAMAFCRDRDDKARKDWAKYDRIVRSAEVTSARTHNLALRAEAANTAPAATGTQRSELGSGE